MKDNRGQFKREKQAGPFWRFVFVEVVYTQPDDHPRSFSTSASSYTLQWTMILSPYIFFLSSGMRSIQDKVIVVLLYVKKKEILRVGRK
jgi:hypothetical protein